MIKAERDERVNITQALTPEKTYMAGFTRPKELRASNWFPGGAYLAQGKVYESPVDEAYQPYTVFLLESRHTVRYGVGRVESEEWIYGACREPELLGVLKKYNSDTAPQYVLEAMDNARWPEGPQLKPKPQQQWWLDAEDLRQTHEELGIPEYKSRRLEIKAHYLRTYFRKTGNPTRAFHSSPILLTNQNLQSSPSIFLPDTVEEWDYLQTPRQPNADAVTRAEYIPTLRDTPFWRPLLTITAASRPIALSILRRCHGLDRGLPYHSVLDNDDKKCRSSYGMRMRTIRINRMRQIALQLAQALAGFRGGLIGVRFEPDTMGRGIAGEGLADPIPYDKRVLSIGVAQWYRLADEIKESFLADAAESIPGRSAFEVNGLDDWGNRRADGGEVVPWRAYADTPVDRLKREAWYKEYVHLLLAEK
ncbi:histone H4, partial [Favolaschia claudopus]